MIGNAAIGLFGIVVSVLFRRCGYLIKIYIDLSRLGREYLPIFGPAIDEAIAGELSHCWCLEFCEDR